MSAVHTTQTIQLKNIYMYVVIGGGGDVCDAK